MDTTKFLKDHIEAILADMDRIQKEISDSDELFELEFGGKAKVVRRLFNNVFKFLTPMQMLDFAKGKIYQYNVYGEHYVVVDCENLKVAVSEGYNFIFNKMTGDFKRWGASYEDDPEYSPIGPEIWDCECTTSCKGIPDKNGIVTPCSFCYKANTPNGKNLLLNDFKKMIDIFPKSLTQIAFGGDSMATSNPDLWEMMSYCRELGVIPNITVANISDEIADKLKRYCGAVACSRYANKDVCYNSVEKLATTRGMNQINIHSMLSLQTFDQCMETAKDMLTDKRLKDMNAIVFLGLKKQGRAKNNFDTVPFGKFEELITFCLNSGIRFGFDSCSACRFEKVVRNSTKIKDDDKKRFIECSESCESGAFSFYTSVDCEYAPCSFTEGESGWEKGVDMLTTNNFLKDIWYHPRNVDWRSRLINSKVDGCRKCLSFPEINV